MGMFDQVNEDLDKLAALGSGIEAIDAIARWGQETVGRSGDALTTINSITATITGMYKGEISAVDTEEEIALVRRALLGNADRLFDRSEL